MKIGLRQIFNLTSAIIILILIIDMIIKQKDIFSIIVMLICMGIQIILFLTEDD